MPDLPCAQSAIIFWLFLSVIYSLSMYPFSYSLRSKLMAPTLRSATLALTILPPSRYHCVLCVA
ncbi:hypothetical protein BMETH_1917_0 [methanotrophic bacterial endosymbiont of Bathymodiolus sp.]|nr:hypothetical protein BMETH_1917_0 [methanotrophic bacterial endosymbiont of Bathymodiolus sp.]